MNPKVSIIIPFYNCPYIQEAIQSAINQTYKNIEIIVVDDGSTKYVDFITPFLDKVRYIQKKNGGTGTALNRGIQEASGEYFCWLSSDDRFLPQKVELQLAFMENQNLMATFSSYYFIDHTSKVISGPIGEVYPNKLAFYRRLKAGCPINGCSVMLNMKVFKEIGLFDETLPFTHDYDYWLRLIQRYQLEYLNTPLLEYRVHDEMGTKKYSDVIKKEIRLVKKRHSYNLKQLIKNEILNLDEKR